MTSRRAAVATLLLACFAQGLLNLPLAASAVVLRARGLSDARYGSLFVPLMTLAALGALGAGLVIERIGARRALAAGFVFMAVSQLALLSVVVVPLGSVYAAALLASGLLGLGCGLAAGPLSAYPQVLFPARSESAVIVAHTVIGLGLSASPLVAGLALERGLWPLYPLLLLTSSAALAVVIDREELPEPEPRVAGAPRARRPSRAGALWLFLTIAFLYGAAESVFGNWGIPFLTEERGLGAAEAGVALGAFWAALAAARIAIAGLVSRVPPAPVLPLLAVLMAAALLLVPQADGPRQALLVFVLGGLGCSAIFPLGIGLACSRFPEHRAWVAGAMFAALCAGLGAGSAVAGLLRGAFDLGSVYRLAALAPTIAAVLAAVSARRRPVSAPA